LALLLDERSDSPVVHDERILYCLSILLTAKCSLQHFLLSEHHIIDRNKNRDMEFSLQPVPAINFGEKSNYLF